MYTYDYICHYYLYVWDVDIAWYSYMLTHTGVGQKHSNQSYSWSSTIGCGDEPRARSSHSNHCDFCCCDAFCWQKLSKTSQQQFVQQFGDPCRETAHWVIFLLPCPSTNRRNLQKPLWTNHGWCSATSVGSHASHATGDLKCGAPKIAKLVYNSNNYGLWYL